MGKGSGDLEKGRGREMRETEDRKRGREQERSARNTLEQSGKDSGRRGLRYGAVLLYVAIPGSHLAADVTQAVVRYLLGGA